MSPQKPYRPQPNAVTEFSTSRPKPSTGPVLTQRSEPANVVLMSTATQEATEKEKLPRGGKLKTGPIMVYPSTPEEREAIVAAATADRRSMSSFIMDVVLSHIRSQEKAKAA